MRIKNIELSDQIQDIHIAVSVVYDTLFFPQHWCSYLLIIHFDCEMKLGVLLL